MSVSDGTLTIVAKNQSVMEKVQEKVDSIIGQAIEVGGVYKGIVTSIKEYGAFVEFNGGQHGLLHVSELSHEPVSKISDVISVGQQLSLMCIGQDLRGNIKLSLKATLPRKTKKSNVGPPKPKPDKFPPTDDSPNQPKNQNYKDLPEDTNSKTKLNSTSPIVIRSAVECDEEEKTARLGPSSTDNSKPQKASKLKTSKKVKNSKFVTNEVNVGSSDSGSASCKTKPYLLTEKKTKIGSNYTSSDDEDHKHTNETLAQTLLQLDDQETKVEGPIDAKTLKFGMKVTAKILQVRARGLVLDLGGGINGMYKFESGGKREFEVGNEVQAQCTSFTSKGIPVMSIMQDD